MSSLKYVNKLRNQRVLVVGASTGVGFCVAEAAVEHGAYVIISSSSQHKLDKAIAKLREHAKANNLGDVEKLVTGKTCDLSKPDTIDDNIVQLLEFATRDGKLDHVAFTAGDAIPLKGIKEVTVNDIYTAGQVRNIGTIILAKHILNYINLSVNSSFTNTSGTSSWRPGPGWSLIIGAGAGAEDLARCLAIDLRPVRANTIQLGAVYTEFFGSVPEEAVPQLKELLKKESVTNTIGTPEEVAEAYIYVMKDTFATGGVVESNGGRLIGDSKEELDLHL